MKRLKNVWPLMCDLFILCLAIENAASGKKKNSRAFKTLPGEPKVTIQDILDNKLEYAEHLRQILINNEFNVSEYEPMVVHSPDKDRQINKLPFFPDRCIQWALSIILHNRWDKSLNADTYASWKGRGINCKKKRHNLNHQIKRALASYPNNVTIYCLVLDIKKCYESVDNQLLMDVNKRFCKDANVLSVCEKFCFSMEGLPIGSYISQLWINLYLSKLDRFCKEIIRIKHYFRYMDNVAIFGTDKHELQQIKWRIANFCWYELHVELNNMRQVFPIAEERKGRGRALDFVGYVYYRHFTLIRKRIKKNYIKNLDKPNSLTSYHGLLKFCNSRNLIRKYSGEEALNKVFCDKSSEQMKIKEIKFKRIVRPFEGSKIKIEDILNKEVSILNWVERISKKEDDGIYFKVQIERNGKLYIITTSSFGIMEFLRQLKPKDCAPIDGVVFKKDDNGYYIKGTLAIENLDEEEEEDDDDEYDDITPPKHKKSKRI